jgi:hypothetical protein
MAESNVELLAKLDAAFKGLLEVNDLGAAVLAPQKFDRFVQMMQESTIVLPAARFIPMQSQRVDIDRTGFVTRILHSGRDNKTAAGQLWPETINGASRDLTGGYGLSAGFAELTFHENQLLARELQAITSLRDDALRRNIEKGNFENTLIDLFSAAAGRDLEEFALLADRGYAYANDDVLSQTSGWVAKAGQKLYGVGAGAGFDPTDDAFPENMFTAMLNALPKQYLGNPGDWKYYVTWDVYDGYRDCLRARGTVLGDSAQTTNMPLYFKGTQIVYCPFLERAHPTSFAGGQLADGLANGAICLLTNPDNMVWGIFHQVQIEREREAKWRRTDFVLSFEGDVHYEDEDAAVAAFIDKTKP